MKIWQGIVIGVLAGLLAAAVILLLSSPPRGSKFNILPPPTPAPLIIQVSGAVHQPGIIHLPPGSRVQDALNACGGALPEGDLNTLNLARVIMDGEKLVVPVYAQSTEIPPLTSPAETILPPGLININTAGQSALESLPGIGPVLAQRILSYRQTYGPFSTINDLQYVPGIGESLYSQIKDHITVTEP